MEKGSSQAPDILPGYHFIMIILATNVIMKKHILPVHIRASTREFVAYRIDEQQMLRRACACAQSRQNLCFSHTQNMGSEEDSDQILDL